MHSLMLLFVSIKYDEAKYSYYICIIHTNSKYGCFECRGHFGGLVGGALVAFLLGPRLQVKTSTQGRKYVVDSPPVPLLASPPIRIS
jgi:hypothetical protein